MPCSWYVQKHAVLLISTYIWRYISSSQHVQTHANTRSTLHTNQQKQTNLQLLIKAKNVSSCSSPHYKPVKCRYTLRSVCVRIPAIVCTQRYIRSPWCLQTQADTWHDQPKCMLICTKSWADADTCSHMQSPHWYMTGYVDNTTAQNARQPMQIRAQLSTRANSC
jgi:hypothetical protein